MIRAGVIGHPVAHSKSPRIHGYWLNQFKIEGTYTAIDIAPDQLAGQVRRLVDEGFTGFNVTLPYKQTIMNLCDSIDQTALQIGAVNTVMIRNGKLFGTNTDAFGFIENLTAATIGARFHCATIVGAGGAARAVIYALRSHGVENLIVTNRTRGHAEDIARHFGDIEVVNWDERHDALSECDLVVNTTSLGMTRKPSLDLPLAALAPTATVCDIVYAPLMTGLLVAASARGNRIVTGIGMLLHQARPGFAAWFGREPAVTPELETLVLS